MQRSRFSVIDIARESISVFIWSQVSRGLFRMRILALAAFSCAFWAVALVVASWLFAWGYGWVAILSLGAWGVIAAPAVLLQSALMLDVAFLLIAKRSIMFPALEAAWGPMARPDDGLRAWGGLFLFGAYTSPLNALSVWCYGVLIRVPPRVRVGRIHPEEPTVDSRYFEVAQSEIWAALAQEKSDRPMAHV